VGQKEGPLTPTKIESSNEYKSESETSIGSALLLYISSPLTPPSSSLLPLSPPPYNRSQHGSINYKQIIQQQQE